uniref:Putative RNA-dependent RNA polymerase n=1 Tax=Rhizoctonia fumigata partitivirus TaxID=1601835 RepID=A0A0B5CMR5_9VIRU|nr:putative RNA-dependent RNA polymerase [Rhizoctonia fumigata partitivirus]
MEYLVHAFKMFSLEPSVPQNLQMIGTYHYKPASPHVHTPHVEAHKKTVLKAMEKYLYPREINTIVNELRRSDVNLESILDDFFDNNVPLHRIPFDEHVEYGLQCMADAFRPPRPARPCHLNDVEHHYPYKWQVNAEAPFATDKYFLDNRHKFRDFYDETTGTWKHADPIDMERRYGNRLDTVLDQITPPKFGYMKNAIFAWTRRWHHIIKDGFTDLTGLVSSTYVRDRFIFPMLLHTKTAIVKKDDPNKMRTIWGCSKPWIIAETMLYWEYIAWVKLNPGITPMLWGYETFTGGWLRLNAALFSSLMKNSFVTLDWKRFDKRAYFELIYRIMLVARTFLDFENGYVPNVNYSATHTDWSHTKAQRIQRLWEWTLDNLFNAPIVLPNGDMYKRNWAGIPSGLFITQLLDSWYNYVMLATLLSALGHDPKACIIKVQGDDSVIRLAVLIPPQYHELFLTRLQDLADHYFGAVISIEKSEVRNELNGVEVLSYKHIHGMPYRDEIAMMAQLYHTKARNPEPSITMAQAVGFAYASCGNHDRVYYALKDIYEYYASQGFAPNPAGLTLVFGNSPDRFELDVPLDHFPTIHEIKKYLLNFEYRNEHQEHKTWPLDYFLNPPCSTL